MQLLLIMTGCLVLRREELDLPSTVTPTSTWSWSPMLVVREMFIQFQSKARKQGGKPCQETGAKTGKATITSTVKAYLFKSPPVMVELSQATMRCLLAGSLVRLLKEASFKISTPFLPFCLLGLKFSLQLSLVGWWKFVYLYYMLPIRTN